MKHLTLTDDERDVLLNVLAREKGELYTEIRRTDTTGLRQELHAQMNTVARIHERLLELSGAASHN